MASVRNPYWEFSFPLWLLVLWLGNFSEFLLLWCRAQQNIFIKVNYQVMISNFPFFISLIYSYCNSLIFFLVNIYHLLYIFFKSIIVRLLSLIPFRRLHFSLPLLFKKYFGIFMTWKFNFFFHLQNIIFLAISSLSKPCISSLSSYICILFNHDLSWKDHIFFLKFQRGQEF